MFSRLVKCFLESTALSFLRCVGAVFLSPASPDVQRDTLRDAAVSASSNDFVALCCVCSFALREVKGLLRCVAASRCVFSDCILPGLSLARARGVFAPGPGFEPPEPARRVGRAVFFAWGLVDPLRRLWSAKRALPGSDGVEAFYLHCTSCVGARRECALAAAAEGRAWPEGRAEHVGLLTCVLTVAVASRCPPALSCGEGFGDGASPAATARRALAIRRRILVVARQRDGGGGRGLAFPSQRASAWHGTAGAWQSPRCEGCRLAWLVSWQRNAR
ncbi:hypothetical protein ERJ75_001496100 [Trypanosoma vivax]|nr:hypothetical protein ERJ75_001496100 [Trypanosoma vivax]